MDLTKLAWKEVEVLRLRCQETKIHQIATKFTINESDVYRIQARAFNKLGIKGEKQERFDNFQQEGGCRELDKVEDKDLEDWDKRKYEIFGDQVETTRFSSTSLLPVFVLLLIVGAYWLGTRQSSPEPTLLTNEPTKMLTLGPTETIVTTLAFTLTPVDIVIAPPTQAIPTVLAEPVFTFTPTISPGQGITIVESTFDGSSTDGWTLIPGRETDLTNPGVGGITTGGDNDGHLRAAPRIGSVSYYVAPPKFNGDWRQYTELKFAIWSQGGEYFTEAQGFVGDIYVANGSLEAWRLISYRPPETWETFVIPLTDDGNWIFGVGTMKLEDVLSNVTDFRIRAEYGLFTDFSGLDNVSLIK